jgi:hypothetical protein
MTLTTMTIAVLVLLFASGPILGNQHGLAYVYHHTYSLIRCTWMHGGHVRCISYPSNMVLSATIHEKTTHNQIKQHSID